MGKMIATIIHLLLLEFKAISGASHHTEVTPLASFYIYGNSTFWLRHISDYFAL